MNGVENPGDGQIPVAPVLEANETVALVFSYALWMSVAATLVWVTWKLVRDRETLPLVLFVAGIVTTNIEPIGDHVGWIVWASNIPWFDYTIMGREMPSFISTGLAAYYAPVGYWAYKQVLQGRSLKTIALVSAVAAGLPEVITEAVMHHFGMIAYYGDNPTKILGIPIYTIVQNSTLLPIVGVVVYLGATRLRGLQQLWLIMALPGVVLGYVFGATWPAYMAVGSSAPAWVVWLTAAWAVTASIGGAYAALQLPELQHRRQLRLDGVDATAAPIPTYRMSVSAAN